MSYEKYFQTGWKPNRLVNNYHIFVHITANQGRVSSVLYRCRPCYPLWQNPVMMLLYHVFGVGLATWACFSLVCDDVCWYNNEKVTLHLST